MRALLILILSCVTAGAQVFSPVPYTFTTGQPYNPSQVQADFQAITNAGNSVGAAINAAIEIDTPEPSGIILWFNLTSCPTGWSSLAGYAPGFVRGLDNGRGLDTTGTGVGAVEGGVLQAHTHSMGGFISGTITTNVFNPAGGNNAPYYTGSSSYSDPSTGGVAGATTDTEVRPINVSLLLCQKN
jgi:hypothetical protein